MIGPSMKDPVTARKCWVEAFVKNGKVGVTVCSELENTTVFLEPEEATTLAGLLAARAATITNTTLDV